MVDPLTPTEHQYAKFGAYVSGILDALIASGNPDNRNLAISLIISGTERYGIEIRPKSYYKDQGIDFN